MDSARALIAHLDLEPHPEGGWYREWFRSPQVLSTPRGPRAAMTSIYYLLEAGQVSRWHVLAADETWHYLKGDPFELLTRDPATGVRERRELGPAEDQLASAVVPAGVWQAARPLGTFSLIGCTVAPGFEFEDLQFASELPEGSDLRTGLLAGDPDLL